MGRSERMGGRCVKLWCGGGEEVNHSSAPPSHGLSPAATGLRHEDTRLTKKKRNENPMMKAPTVDSWLSPVQPLVVR